MKRVEHQKQGNYCNYNIEIDGICNDGNLYKAIEIVNGMWTH